MIATLKEDFKYEWNLITIDDPSYISGKSTYNIIKLILKSINFSFVILDNIEGSGKEWLIASLQRKKNIPIKINDFLKLLKDVKQFDWGDFFLFKTYPNYWNNIDDVLYPAVIAKTDTTIRVIDNQYFYIYTPFQEIASVLKEHYEIESIRTDALDKLDYPY